MALSISSQIQSIDWRLFSFSIYLKNDPKKPDQLVPHILNINASDRIAQILHKEIVLISFQFNHVLAISKNIADALSATIYFKTAVSFPIEFFTDSSYQTNRIIDIIAPNLLNNFDITKILSYADKIGVDVLHFSPIEKRGKFTFSKRLLLILKTRLIILRDLTAKLPLNVIELEGATIQASNSNRDQGDIPRNCIAIKIPRREYLLLFPNIAVFNENLTIILDLIGKLKVEKENKIAESKNAPTEKSLIHQFLDVHAPNLEYNVVDSDDEGDEKELPFVSEVKTENKSKKIDKEPDKKFNSLKQPLKVDNKTPKLNKDIPSKSIAAVSALDHSNLFPLKPLLQTDTTIVYSWGDGNKSGQLDTPNTSLKNPRRVTTLDARHIRYLSGCSESTAALTDTGQLFVWGTGKSLGLGERITSSPIPYLLVSLRQVKVIKICVGYEHALILSQNNDVYTWGSEELTGFGVSLSSPHQIPFLDKKEIINISANDNHSAAYNTDGTLFLWGKKGPWLAYEEDDEGGAPFNQTYLSVITRYEQTGINMVSCGFKHTGVLSSGVVDMCGVNNNGELGLGNSTPSATFLPITVLDSCVYISCGNEYTGIITSDGGIYTFGNGKGYRLGHGTEISKTSPKQIGTLSLVPMASIICGNSYTLAIQKEGLLLHWGTHGQNKNVIKYPQVVDQLQSHFVYSVCNAANHTVVSCVKTNNAVQIDLKDVTEEGTKNFSTLKSSVSTSKWNRPNLNTDIELDKKIPEEDTIIDNKPRISSINPSMYDILPISKRRSSFEDDDEALFKNEAYDLKSLKTPLSSITVIPPPEIPTASILFPQPPKTPPLDIGGISTTPVISSPGGISKNPVIDSPPSSPPLPSSQNISPAHRTFESERHFSPKNYSPRRLGSETDPISRKSYHTAPKPLVINKIPPKKDFSTLKRDSLKHTSYIYDNKSIESDDDDELPPPPPEESEELSPLQLSNPPSMSLPESPPSMTEPPPTDDSERNSERYSERSSERNDTLLTKTSPKRRHRRTPSSTQLCNISSCFEHAVINGFCLNHSSSEVRQSPQSPHKPTPALNLPDPGVVEGEELTIMNDSINMIIGSIYISSTETLSKARTLINRKFKDLSFIFIYNNTPVEMSFENNFLVKPFFPILHIQNSQPIQQRTNIISPRKNIQMSPIKVDRVERKLSPQISTNSKGQTDLSPTKMDLSRKSSVPNIRLSPQRSRSPSPSPRSGSRNRKYSTPNMYNTFSAPIVNSSSDRFKDYNCDKCNKGFFSLLELNKHVFVDHPPDIEAIGSRSSSTRKKL